MQRYDSYKPSGVEWIAQIPSHWEVRRLKHLFAGNTGVNITKSDLEDEGCPVISYGQIHSKENPGTRIVDDLIRYMPQEKTQEKAKAEYGDFIFADTSEDLEGCGNCVWIDRKTPLFAGYHTILLKCLKPIKSSYLAYLFRTDDWRGQIRSRVYGVKVYSITQSILSLTTTLFPPLEEQERIAEYLDRRCAEIDGIINKEEQAIALLDELKQSIISEAVTRGLDPDAPLKPSGVDWIGNIPSHWQVWKVSHMFDNIGSGTTPSSSNKEYYTGSEGYHWLQTGDLNDGIIRSTSKMVTQKAIDDYKLKFYPENSLVIAMYGATIGKIGLLDIDTATNQACCVLPSSKVCLPIYAFYQFTAAKRYLLMEAVGGGQPNISQDIIKRTMVPLPPLEEQERIAEYLDQRCAEIDEAKERKQRQIELLREMKQIMISDAVTGRIKVF